MRTCLKKFSLKVLLALMLTLTCFNLIHTKDFYEVSLSKYRNESLESEASYSETRHYGVLNKYEEHIEKAYPAEAKKLYASHHADYSASVELRDRIQDYGFYELDKYQNIHHIKIKDFSAFRRGTLLFRECDWFSLRYSFDENQASKYCSKDYIKVSDDPILSEAIKQELADAESSAKSNEESDYSIARDEAIFRFVELLIASIVVSLAISFGVKRYWPAL